MDETAAMHRTLMLYVNESGFYALNEKYSAENLLVNILDAVKHSVKLSGRLRKDGTPSNAMVISSLSRICVMPFCDTPSFEDRYASFFSHQSAITMQSLSTFFSKCSLSMALFLSRER